jgi:hypothetical protein
MLLLDIQKNIVFNFVKLRISNSNLLIEQGRHQNIPLENRLCPICNLEIENEYHFVIECNKLTSSRSKLYTCKYLNFTNKDDPWFFYLSLFKIFLYQFLLTKKKLLKK